LRKLLDPRHLVRPKVDRSVLSDYQTRVIEAFVATLMQNLPALRESLDNLAVSVRNPRALSDESGLAWLQIEETLHHLDLLDRASDHTINSRSSRAGISMEVTEARDVIRGIRSRELRKLLSLLHAIAGTPIEGHISGDCS
jgi:hypothetical protein